MKRSLHKYLVGMACALGALLGAAGNIHAAAPPVETVFLDWTQPWSYLVPDGLAHNPDQAVNQNFTTDWFTPGYDTSAPVTVIDELLGTVDLPWLTAPGPFDWGTVNGLTALNPTPINSSPEVDLVDYSAYFRTEFNLASPVNNVVVEYYVDDRAVWFLDGVEIPSLRTAPDTAGALPLYSATAPEITTLNEDNLQSGSIANIPAGNHTLAVIVHQAGTGSSDLGFGAKLIAPGGARVWTTDVSDDWHNAANWRAGDVATTQTEYAVFGDAFGGQHTIWNDQAVSLDGLQFDNTNKYNIGGKGMITLQGNARAASLNALQGDHELQLPVRLGNNTDVSIIRTGEVSASITLRNQFDLNGRTATLTGGGEIRVMSDRTTGTSGTLNVSAGSLAGDGTLRGNLVVGSAGIVNPTGVSAASTGEARASILTVAGNATFNAGSNLTLNLYGNGSSDKLVVTSPSTALAFNGGPTITVNLATGYTPAAGHTFDVLDFNTLVGPMPAPALPDVSASNLQWVTTNFASQGVLSLSPAGPVGDPCDFDGDNDCDVNDINALTAVGNLATGVAVTPATAKYDLNSDSTINGGDITAWLAGAADVNGFVSSYLLGDTNLTGKVDFPDFVNLNNNWQKTEVSPGNPVVWSSGDFNGDKIVNFLDFVNLNNNWQRQVAMGGAAAAAVPEPAGLALFGLGLLGLAARRRR